MKPKRDPAPWLPPRACANCGVVFFTKNNGQLCCEACQPIARKAAEVAAIAQKKWKEKMALEQENTLTAEQSAHMREILQ
jgi:uncharacterized Zn finger protein (UPF0148 family)